MRKRKTNWYCRHMPPIFNEQTRIVCILTCFSAAVIRHWPKATWERMGLFPLIAYSPLLREAMAGARGRNWRQELKQKPLRNVLYWLAPYGLLSLLSSTTQDNKPKGSTTRSGLGPPTSVIIKKMPPRHAHRLSDGDNSVYCVKMYCCGRCNKKLNSQ